MRYSQIKVTSVKRLEDALKVLEVEGEDVRIISGGTDVAVYIKDGNLKQTLLLDISGVRQLDYVKDDVGYVSIGARATFSRVIGSPVARRYAPLVCKAGVEVGSLQIRNLATVAGNICNASPAADSLPPLYVHESTVILESRRRRREVAISDFVTGPRRVAKMPDELLTEIRVPKMQGGASYFFKKLGLRSSQAISVVSIASLWLGRRARIALGAVAPTVVRARAAEEYIARNGVSLANLEKVRLLVARDASPITDLRGTREYRAEAIRALAYEGFYEALRGGAQQ